MSGERRSLWRRIFGGRDYAAARRDRVIVYIVRRLDDGVPLEEIVEEEYVRRMATRAEVERILASPELIESVRERMHRELGTEPAG
mgnify:CR=1 FL=1